MIKLEPMFGASPHVPAICAESRKRKGRRRTAACPTCGGSIKDGSTLICMSCHRTAADLAATVARDALPPLSYDRRFGDGLDKQREKAKADAKAAKKKAAKLTKRERKGLLRDAKAGEQPLPVVKAFLDGLAAVA